MDTFEEWMFKVDQILVRWFGLPSMDMPDWHYANAFEDGLSPMEAAESFSEDFEAEGA
jgi:Family of unknown function (DUF5419)